MEDTKIIFRYSLVTPLMTAQKSLLLPKTFNCQLLTKNYYPLLPKNLTRYIYVNAPTLFYFHRLPSYKFCKFLASSNYIELYSKFSYSPNTGKYRPYLDTFHVRSALLGLRQFLATESALKMMKNGFYFTSKAVFFLKIFKFLS